jgi:mono/diheme cytochrome c family protein
LCRCRTGRYDARSISIRTHGDQLLSNPPSTARILGLALTLAGALPHGAGAQAGSRSTFATRKAEALLRDHLPCLGCHAWGDEGGRLAPDLRTVRQRRSATYVAAIVDDPQRVAPGSIMPRTVMQRATRDAVVGLLQSGTGNGNSETPVSARDSQAPGGQEGAALYARWCAACHGTGGGGDGPNAAHLPVKPAVHGDARIMSRRSDDALYDTIAGGGAIMNRSPRMPAFGETLSATQIRTLVAYIRQLCRCEGPAWSTR